MPDHPQWFQRVGEILRCLEASDVPFVDRFAVEQLFHVQRRQAIRILSALGGYQLGRTFLVERETVITALRRLASEGRFRQSSAQRKRIWSVITREQGRLRARAISLPSPAVGPPGRSLPPGVGMTAGELRVRFDSPIGLLERLMALAEAAARDYDWFESLCEGCAVCESEVSKRP